MPQLRFLDEEGRLKTVTLAAEPCTVGRVATCQVVFPDDMVSREHARLDREPDGRYRIRDLGSRNKTFVNGQMVAETLLTGGDILRIGDHVLEYLDERLPSGELSMDFTTPDRKDPLGSEWVKIKSPVTLSLDQLGQLAGVTPMSSALARPEDVAEAGLTRLLIDLQADRGLIALKGEAKRELRPVAQRGLIKPSSGAFTPVSETFLHAPLLQQVAGRYPQQASQMDLKAGYAVTAMITPLVHRGEIVGLIYVDRCTAKQPFSAMALQQLIAAGAQLGAGMGEASRRLTEGSLRDGAAWLTGVRRAQESLNVLPGASELFPFAVKCFPGRARCGDLHDFHQLDDHTCYLAMFDCGGQGMTGLAQALALRTALRTGIAVASDLEELGTIFTAMNHSAAELKTRQLVQCLAVGLNLRSGRATYVNAGGAPPLLMSGPSRLVTLDQTTLLLGIDRNYVYEPASVDLSSEFRLLCHTDGLTESVNGSGEAFGAQRLHDVLLQREAFGSPSVVIDKLTTALNTHLAGHPQEDDVLMMVVGS